MELPELDELLRKYKEGTCTPEENRLIEAWFQHTEQTPVSLSDAEKRVIEQRLLARLRAATRPAGSLKAGAMGGRVVEQTEGLKVLQKARAGTGGKVTRIAWLRWAAAAAILLALTTGIWLFRTGREDVKVFTVAAGAGQIRQVTLPDGTQVTLNAASVLSWKTGFNKQERRVSLEGEGFFDVKSDADRPFILTTNHLETRVLGTAFNAEAYTNEGQIRISLVRGQVRVADNRNPDQQATLRPGQMVAGNTAQGTILVKPIAVGDPAAWIKGELIFNDIPLATALQRLQKKYQLEIQFDPGLIAGKTVTASLTNISWQEALTGILFTHGLHFSASKGKIIIR